MPDEGELRLDRKSFDRIQERRGRDRANAHRPVLEYLTQAEVKASNLTGRPEWDFFLSQVQFAIEQTEKQAAAWQAQLDNPECLSHTDLLRAKMERRACLERIGAWEAVISLPKEIMEKGQEAGRALSELVGDTGDGSEDSSDRTG